MSIFLTYYDKIRYLDLRLYRWIFARTMSICECGSFNICCYCTWCWWV